MTRLWPSHEEFAGSTESSSLRRLISPHFPCLPSILSRLDRRNMCLCCLAHESVPKARFDPLNRPISCHDYFTPISCCDSFAPHSYHLKIKFHSIPRRCQPPGHPLFLPFSKAFAPIHSVTEQSDGRPFPHRSCSSRFTTDGESVGYGDSGLDFLPPGGGWVASISTYLNRTPVEVFREFRTQTDGHRPMQMSLTSSVLQFIQHADCLNLLNPFPYKTKRAL